MRQIQNIHIAPYWYRVGAFVLILFFVLLSDAILSDFVPGYIQRVVGSSAKMGWVMAVSSIVGIWMDLLFPQLLRKTGVKKLAGLAIVGGGIFLLSMWGSTLVAPILLIIIGMMAWGVYYELDAFMTKQFVAKVAPTHTRGAVWGVISTFRNLAYLIGPLIGTLIVAWGDRGVIQMAGGILIVAYVLFNLIQLPDNEIIEEEIEEVGILDELSHWIILGKRVWPVLLMSLVAGLVDSVFWTTGTVVNDVLAKQGPKGGWFLSMYMLPSLIVGLVIARWGIYQRKKKWATTFLFIGGLLLTTITRRPQIEWVLGVVFVASLFLGLAWPLIDATYTDFTVRMRKGRKHMIGISSSILSLAYVVGPILAGFVAQRVGELASFVWLGWLVVMVATALFLVTPKKIRLPELEIEKWDRVQ